MRLTTDVEIVDRLAAVDAPLVLCGHDQLARFARLDDGRTIFAPGSVGCPACADDSSIPHRVKSGAPHAREAIATRASGSASVDLIAIPYDWSAAAKQAEENAFPGWVPRRLFGRNSERGYVPHRCPVCTGTPWSFR